MRSRQSVIPGNFQGGVHSAPGIYIAPRLTRRVKYPKTAPKAPPARELATAAPACPTRM